MHEKFTELKLNLKNQLMLSTVNEILIDYQEQGYVLTLRQLYYQLVSRDIIPNEDSEYKKLGALLKKGRMAGEVDWNAIEDRTRKPQIPYCVEDVQDAIEDTINQYRLDRMSNQDVYIEVWIEKDALSGIIRRITQKYHVHLQVNKGYGSTSSTYDAYNRFYEAIKSGKTAHILYLGDHDPSGLDMVRDIEKRISDMLFVKNEGAWYTEILDQLSDDKIDDWIDELLSYANENLEAKEFFDTEEKVHRFDWIYAKYKTEESFSIKQIGLTMSQIRQFNPPPNPAKLTDPRSKWYVKKYGAVSWEVDALNPQTLNNLVDSNISSLIDSGKMEEILEQEQSDIKTMREKFSE